MADDRARRDLDAALDDLRRADGDRGCVETWLAHGLRVHRRSRWRPTRCPTSGSGCCYSSTFGVSLGWFPIGGIERPDWAATRGSGCLLDEAHHMFLPALDADARLPRRVRDRDALVAARHDARGLPHARAGEGPARRRRAEPSRRAERDPPDRHAHRDQLRLRPLGRDRSRDDLLVARSRAADVSGAERHPTSRCCRGCFSCSARR